MKNKGFINNQTTKKTNLKKNKDKRKATIIVFILIVFWSVGSILGSISFFRSNNIKTASADTVTTDYIYTSSNLIIPLATYNSDFTPAFATVQVGTINIRVSSYNDTLLFAIKLHSFHNSVIYNQCIADNNIYSSADSDGYLALKNGVDSYINRVGNQGYFARFLVTGDIDAFNADIYTVEFNSTWRLWTESSVNGVIIDNTITYSDVNNNKITLHNYIPINSVLSSTIDLYRFEERLYILNPSYDVNEEIAFENGKKIGYEEGKADYLNSGWQDGYNRGKSDGEEVGYQKGLTDANQYTFLALLGAVVDVPIKAFSGLFNFTILGINMLEFATGIFTLMVIVIIIKIIIGKG